MYRTPPYRLFRKRWSKATLHKLVQRTGNSFFGDTNGNIQKVQCLAFDEFCERENLGRIDWIKIDVGGAELEVLGGGMKSTLEGNPQARILIELCPDNLKRASRSADELLSRLHELGFRVDALAETVSSFKV